jgi:fructoselysine-6-P-deglycase FrlB-like protein
MGTAVMHETSPMLRDIGRQPDVLTTLAGRAAEIRAAAAGLGGGGGRVFVTGCGDGLFAGLAATGRARRLGLDWRAVGPLDLLVGAADLRPDDRIVAVSMSGNVDRTVEAARMAEDKGLAVLALVNGGGGRLGAIAGARISLDLPDIAPFLCGTASYTATLAVLMTIAEGFAGADGLDLAPVAAAQRAGLAAAEVIVDTVAATAPSGVRLLSAGCETGTTAYGAAKFVELTRLPAWSGELEEFAHSQYWSMPVRDLVVIVSTDPILAPYAVESARALGRLGVATLAVDTAATPVETASWRITLPDLPPDLAPLASAVPLQLLARAVARAQGLDPDTRLHLKSDELRFEVSRRLTRRSLLGTGL